MKILDLAHFLRGFAFWLLITVLLVIGMAGNAHAQGTLTLTPSVTSGNGSLSTRLTWSTNPAAQSCTASGHSSWTGSKAASGAQDLPPITLSGTYTLSLNCSWPGDNMATLKWSAPTTNTDGTALAKCSATVTGNCLASFNVYRAPCATFPTNGCSPEMTTVPDPNATSKVLTTLASGTHYFGVEAVNSAGVASGVGNVVSKVISGTATRNAAVTVTVNPKPSAPPATVE